MNDFLLNFRQRLTPCVGEDSDRVYKAVLNRDTPQEIQTTSERHFGSKCSAMLWLWDETW